MTERIIIILFILIVGCTRVCRSQNKSTREVDRIAVKELTENLGKGQKNIFEERTQNEKKGGDIIKVKAYPRNNN